jgi:hypothetical protein
MAALMAGVVAASAETTAPLRCRSVVTVRYTEREMDSCAPVAITEVDTRLKTAYHECGHAIALFLLGHRFERISIIPRPSDSNGCDSLGRVIARPSPAWTLSDLVDEVVVTCAGEAAVRFVLSAERPPDGFPPDSYLPDRGDRSDYQRAEAIARLATNAMEAPLLLRWLEVRTATLVLSGKFQHLLRALVPPLLVQGELSYRVACRILRRALRTAPGRVRGRRGRAALWIKTRRYWISGTVKKVAFMHITVMRRHRRRRRR